MITPHLHPEVVCVNARAKIMPNNLRSKLQEERSGYDDVGAKTSKLGAPGSATLMRTNLPCVPNVGVTGMPYHDSD